MTVLKDRARGDRHLVSALSTAPAGTSHRPRRVSCASRTYPSPGPAQRAQVRRASLLPAEASCQFQQGPRIVLAHVEKHYILGLVASSKYPSLALCRSGAPPRSVRSRYNHAMCPRIAAESPPLFLFALMSLVIFMTFESACTFYRDRPPP